MVPLGVEHLVQAVACPLSVAFRPEVGEDLVAAQATVACNSQEGQEGQPAALGERPRRRFAPHQERQTAKRPHAKRFHRDVPGESLLNRGLTSRS